MIYNFSMILVCFSLVFTNPAVQDFKPIELFDIGKEQVVRSIPSDASIQKEAESCLQGITNIYVRFRPIPSKGYMVKIPLENPVQVDNPWVKCLVDQIILVFPGEEKPYLLVFDNRNRLTCLTFEGKTDALLKKLELELDPATGGPIHGTGILSFMGW